MSTEADLSSALPEALSHMKLSDEIRAKDYRKYFRPLLPTFMREATHFTVDEYLLYTLKSSLDFINCHLVFNCQAWTKLRYLTIRQPGGNFLLELPPQLDELYLCCDWTAFRVLSPWNRCRRLIHDWDNDRNLVPYLPDQVVCDEYLIRATTCESLIDLFNLGYGYVKTVMYTPPKRFALFEGPSTPHTRRPRTMEVFTRYSTPPPYPLPPLEYAIVARNNVLIRRCLKRMMQSWPQDPGFFQDVHRLIQALNEIDRAAPLDRDELQSEFSEIPMLSKEGRRWRARLSHCLTCYNHFSEEDDFDFLDASSLSESSESEMSEDSWEEAPRKPIYANDPLPGYEHFSNPPPVYAQHHETL